MQTKTALITGITGQDGSLLAEYLINKKYKVFAPVRDGYDKQNLEFLKVVSNPNIQFIEYSKYTDFQRIITETQPDELYHLAAMSHVGESHKNPAQVFQVNTSWTLEILTAITNDSPKTRLFFASTCEVFDKSQATLVYEESDKKALNPYAISKLAAHNMVEYFRDVKKIHASNAILFNHESILRPDTFVTQKVFKNVARIAKYGGHAMELGNVLAEKDWGYAPDFIPAFHLMLQQNQPGDYVLATGELYSVKELVQCSFASLEIDITWIGAGQDLKAYDEKGRCVVKINPKFYRPLDISGIKGDWNKAKNKLGWQGSRPFKDWVKELTMNQLRKI